MRIAILTMTGLLTLSYGIARAETPAQQVHQDNVDIRHLNHDIDNNRSDLSKDKRAASDQRADLARDRADGSADELRADQDLAKGNRKGAAYWNNQRLNENAKARTEKKDLSHTYKDVKADRTRFAKDVQVRHRDIAKRNKSAGKI